MTRTTIQNDQAPTSATAIKRVDIVATLVEQSDDAPHAQPISGQTLLSTIHHGTRLRRAAKNYFAFLGLALVVALIPPFHIIELAVFLFISIFMAINAYVDDAEITGLELVCAKCGQAVKNEKTLKDNYPFWVKCPGCQAEYRINKAPRA